MFMLRYSYKRADGQAGYCCEGWSVQHIKTVFDWYSRPERGTAQWVWCLVEIETARRLKQYEWRLDCGWKTL